MREDPGNLLIQCDLLALGAKLEAARSGDAGRRLARQAARLQVLARSLCEDDESLSARELAQRPENRLERVASLQRKIDALAFEIGAFSRRECAALQFEDVESGVVVYSKQHAGELRAQLGRIGALQNSLQADMASDLQALSTMAAAESRCDGLPEACVNLPSQIALDRGDGEMF